MSKSPEDEYQTRLAIKLFNDRIMEQCQHAIPTVDDLKEAKRIIGIMLDFTMRMRIDKEVHELPNLISFADRLTGLILLAEVGYGALTAMYKLNEIEELKKKLAKQDKCPITDVCILKRDHPGDCITL